MRHFGFLVPPAERSSGQVGFPVGDGPTVPHASLLGETDLMVTHAATSSATLVEQAIEDVLADQRYQRAAASVAEASRLEGGPAAAAADVEALIPG
jgi:hypothetical protein